MFLKAKEYKIIDFFENHFVEIPEYQRPYCWEQEDAENLINDLIDFFTSPSPSTSEGMYFLGSIVLVAANRRARRWQLLDGQQRLATLTMIFSAYRSLLSEQQFIDEVDRLIVVRRGGILQPRHLEFRVILQNAPRIPSEEYPDLTSDNAFFQHFIQEKGNLAQLEKLYQDNSIPVPSQRRMMENVLTIRKLLVEYHTIDPNQLTALMRFLVRNTYFVVAKTNSLENAFRIFTVLNTRGIDLSARDFLKAEVIGAIAAPKQSEYAEKWEDVESTFLQTPETEGETNLSSLLEYMAYLVDRTRARENRQVELVRIIRQHYRETKQIWGEKFVDEVLYPFVRAFSVLKLASLDPLTGIPASLDYTEACNRYLRYFRRLSLHDDWIPILLELILRWGFRNPQYDSKPDHAKLSTLLQALERRVICYVILGIQSKRRQEFYSRLLNMLEDNSIGEICSELELSEDEKMRMIERLGAADLYLKKKYVKYVLLRIDEFLSQSSAIYEKLPEIISIEHVLPQNPKLQWLTTFPDASDRKNLTNCIGNLVLLPLPINIDASNLPFNEKCNKYFFAKDKMVNPFAITNGILQYAQWTPDVIRERKDFLLEKCKIIWKLN